MHRFVVCVEHNKPIMDIQHDAEYDRLVDILADAGFQILWIRPEDKARQVSSGATAGHPARPASVPSSRATAAAP